MAISILIVEDEIEAAELVAGYLRRHGFEVETSNEGFAAFEILEKKRFDAVLLDLMMLPIGGLALLDRLRAVPGYSQTPVYVISAKILSDEERKGLLSHGARFIPKPFHPLQLLERLRQEVRPRP